MCYFCSVQISPATNVFQRKFVNEVRRCEEMERKLRFFETEVKKENLTIDYDYEEQQFEAPKVKDMLSLETRLDKLEKDLKDVISNKEAMNKNYLELIEFKHVLNNALYFFEEVN